MGNPFATDNAYITKAYYRMNSVGNDFEAFESSVAIEPMEGIFVVADSNNNDSFAFYNNGNIVINNEGSAILNIVDVLGRTISSQTINGSENVSINAKAGIYTLQLIQGEKVMTQKIVIE